MSVPIFFIYADDCSHCQDALNTLNAAILKSKIPCNLSKFLYNSKAAIKIAVAHGIDDLPGILIGAGVKTFNGKNYSEKEIIEAIKKASKI